MRRATGEELSGEGFRQRRSPAVTDAVTVIGEDGAYMSFIPGPTCALGTHHFFAVADGHGGAQVLRRQGALVQQKMQTNSDCTHLT